VGLTDPFASQGRETEFRTYRVTGIPSSRARTVTRHTPGDPSVFWLFSCFAAEGCEAKLSKAQSFPSIYPFAFLLLDWVSLRIQENSKSRSSLDPWGLFWTSSSLGIPRDVTRPSIGIPIDAERAVFLWGFGDGRFVPPISCSMPLCLIEFFPDFVTRVTKMGVNLPAGILR